MVLEDSMIFRVCTFRGFKTAIHAGHPTPGSKLTWIAIDVGELGQRAQL